MQLEELSNISDNLAMMPDPALQQFAQMHKTDPYMVSLALSESNRRKKLRTAKQGQAGAMPQPKVADAAIAGMAPAPVAQTQLPEDQGIGALDVPNMEGLADGGIAGYGDGDDVPRRNGDGMAQGGMYDFAQRSEPVVRMSGGGMAGYMPGFNKTGSVNAAFEAALQKTLGYEGGYVEDDAGKGPSNFGINASANPDVDVKNLTKDKARELYKKRYWDAIGGDALAAKNPALATVAFDTAVNMGVGKANQLVAKAKGDPTALLGMRQQHYDNLVKKDPEKFAPFEKGWKARVADLATSVIPSAEAGELPKPAATAPEYQGQKATDTDQSSGAGITSLAGASGAALGAADKMRQLYNANTPLTRTGSMLRNLTPATQMRIASQGAGTAAMLPAAVGTIGGAFTAGATNALSNATPEQLEQLQGDIGSDTGIAAAILNPENRKPENAPKMSSGEQIAKAAAFIPKFITQHPDLDRMREANKAKEDQAKPAYDPYKMEPVRYDEFGPPNIGPEALDLSKKEMDAVAKDAKEATPVEARKGLTNDDYLMMGLSLLANKSPNLGTAIGEAGVATLGAKRAREKDEREEARLKGSEELQRAQAKYYTAYGDAIERGAKEKNLELEAEKKIGDRMEAWDKANKAINMTNPTARMEEEARIRQQIYASLGIKPIMAGQANPASQSDPLGILNKR